MEDVLDVYTRPYDPRAPQVCMDETHTQLLGEVREPLPVRAWTIARHDPEYVRGGVANLFLVCEPLRGWRHVSVTERRTGVDWAHCIKDLVDVYYPDAEKIVLVLDQLNTHTVASLYEAFPPAEAKRHRGSVGDPPHAEARQLAEHGRDRVQRAWCANASDNGSRTRRRCTMK